NPLRTMSRLFRMLLWHRWGAAFGSLIAVLGVGFALLAAVVHYSVGNALYLTFMDAAGASVTTPLPHAPAEAAQLLLTFDAIAFLPLVTAAIVGARLTGPLYRRRRAPDRAVRV